MHVWGLLKAHVYIQELSRKYPDISVGHTLYLLLHHILVTSAPPETLT